MKKSIFGLFALMMVFLFSCADDRTSTGKGRDGMVDFAVKVAIPQGIKTYASENGGATNLDGGNYDLRYIMEVHNMDGSVAYRDYKIVSGDFNNQGVNFNVRLLAKEYNFVFWADFVLKSSGGHDDLYYKTSDAPAGNSQDAIKADLGLIGAGLADIELRTDVATDGYGLSNDARDAYFKVVPVDLRSMDQMQPVTLQRPFGKYRLIATDVPQNLDFKVGTDLLGGVTIDYAKAMGTNAKVPYKFNALTDEVDMTTLMPVTAYTALSHYEASTVVGGKPYDKVYVLASDYVFAPAATDPSNPSTLPTVTMAFDATVNDNSATPTQVGFREISSIPLQRNKLTTVIGNFFTNTALMQVIVDDAFVNGENVLGADISQDITAADGYKIVIPSGSTQDTLTYIFTGNVEDGAVITITDENVGTPAAGTNFGGKVNIGFTKPNNATVVIYTPLASVNFFGTVGSVVANTATSTLVVLKDSNIGNLTVEGGNAEIYGKVTAAATSGTGKVFWGVASVADIAAALARTDANNGIVFVKNITGVTQQVAIANDGYTVDGKGHTLSGAVTTPLNISKNLLAIAKPLAAPISNVTIQNITLTNSLGNGMVAQQADGITLDHVNLINNAQAGAVINGSKVTATYLHTEGNVWGGVNIDKPSGVTIDPEFDFGDGTSTFDDVNPVWADNVTTTTTYKVTYPSDWTVTLVGTQDFYHPISDVPALASLQDAIDNATAGSTLNLAAGATYDVGTALIINKNIIINGNGAKISSTQAQTNFDGTDGVTKLDDKNCSAALFVTNSADVTLNNVNLVVASTVLPSAWGGIILASGKLTINGGSVEGGRFSSGDPTANGIGLIQYAGESVVTGAVFKNFSKGGIYVVSGTTAISNSQFIAVDGFSYSQNGIVLGYPAHGTPTSCLVKNCTFSDFHYAQAPLVNTSCGIITYYLTTPTATFQNNTFNNCDIKIADGNTGDELYTAGM